MFLCDVHGGVRFDLMFLCDVHGDVRFDLMFLCDVHGDVKFGLMFLSGKQSYIYMYIMLFVVLFYFVLRSLVDTDVFLFVSLNTSYTSL